MLSLLWLLLPVAAASGWFAASRALRRDAGRETSPYISGEYIQGLNFLLNEQPDKALEVFMRIVEVDPETVETHLLLGNLFRRRGEVDRAIRIHQNLVARTNIAPAHRSSALLELGRDYLKAGLLDRAEVLFRDVIDIGQHRMLACKHLMEVYEQEKDWEQAIKVAQGLQSKTGVSQGHVIAHYCCEIAESQVSRGMTAEAEKTARAALSHDRDCARASILLGDIALSSKNYQRAIRHYSRVYGQDTDYLCLVLPRLRDAYARREDSEGYLHYLREIQPSGCDHTIIMTLLESYLREGDMERVLSVFESEFRKQPVSLSIVREYARMLADGAIEPRRENIETMVAALDSHLNSQVFYQCNHCGFESRGMFWQCPGCHHWGTVRPAARATKGEPKRKYSV